MADYPGSITSQPTDATNTTDLEDTHPNRHNGVADEVNAIETTLGTNPQGTHATVKDRLDDHQHSGGDGGQVNHDGLDGLTDDDHTQYLNESRHDGAHSVGRWERITTGQDIANNTLTTVVYNGAVAEDDPDGDFTMNTSTGVLTINNAGWYEVVAGIIWANNSTGIRLANIRRNGSELTEDRRNGAEFTGTTVATIFKFAAADTVDVVARQTSGGPLAILALPRNNFCIRRL